MADGRDCTTARYLLVHTVPRYTPTHPAGTQDGFIRGLKIQASCTQGPTATSCALPIPESASLLPLSCAAASHGSPLRHAFGEIPTPERVCPRPIPNNHSYGGPKYGPVIAVSSRQRQTRLPTWGVACCLTWAVGIDASGVVIARPAFTRR